MNQGKLTGGVCEAAQSARTPKTAEAPSIRRVMFKVATQDSLHGRSYWSCEIEGDEAKLDMLEAELQPGRGVTIDYELAARPFYKHGVRGTDTKFLRVLHIELAPQQSEIPEPVEA